MDTNQTIAERTVLSAKLDGLIIQQAYQDWQRHVDQLIAEGKSMKEAGEAWREYARQALETAHLKANDR